MLRVPQGKQAELIADSDAWINIAEGSVRSGKTAGFLLRWLVYLLHAPEGELILTGKTRDTVKRNILDELVKWLPEEDIQIKQNECTIFGRRHYIIGANDERAELKIRGLTLAGALCDELTTYPESFFVMLLSRLSIKGAKLFGTTNPDSPYHWLLKNYLEKDLDLKRFKFKLEDNPHLPPEYVENLKKTYTGLWYKRFIEGLWCVAEGSIYDMFDEDVHVVDKEPFDIAEWHVSVDYGTSNPCVFLMIGLNKDRAYCEKEYYWDSVAHGKQKTDADYADDLITFIGNKPIKSVIVDPSALSFKVELRKRNIKTRDAKNDVLDGIRVLSNMLMDKRYFVNKSCINHRKEFSAYVWDEKSQVLGVDKPTKQSDHSMDAARYFVYTIIGKELVAVSLKSLHGGSGSPDAKELNKWFKKI